MCRAKPVETEFTITPNRQQHGRLKSLIFLSRSCPSHELLRCPLANTPRLSAWIEISRDQSCAAITAPVEVFSRYFVGAGQIPTKLADQFRLLDLTHCRSFDVIGWRYAILNRHESRNLLCPRASHL